MPLVKSLTHTKGEKHQLSPLSTKCIFLGYRTDGEIGYRLWDPESWKLIRSNDVVFNEDSILSNPSQPKKSGKKDSFEEDVERPTHWAELMIRLKGITLGHNRDSNTNGRWTEMKMMHLNEETSRHSMLTWKTPRGKNTGVHRLRNMITIWWELQWES